MTSFWARHQGFTLIELVAVIVLLGVLAVSVAPRFMRDSEFDEFSTRDQVVAVAHIAQQRAMHDHSTCYRLSIAGDVVSVQSQASGYGNVGPAELLAGLTLKSIVSSQPVRVYFDGLGNALGSTVDCGGAIGDTAISIQGTSSLQVCIHGVGYIKPLSC